MRERGLDPFYVPHAIDTQTLKPNPDAGVAARNAMGVPQDAFLIGMVANNSGISPVRKSFPEVFHAFALFREQHSDAYLYVHSDAYGIPDGLNLMALYQTFGIPEEAIRFVNQDKYGVFYEITTQHLSYMYSALDVLACPSYGEGFGIPIIEAQACGTPAIVTDWSAMTELVGPGWLVDGEPYYHPGDASFFKKPAISEIIDAFEKAYEAKGNEKIAEESRKFALRYDADTVFEEHWVPTLEALSKPKEVPPIGNRAARRAKAKEAVAA
jgi:glycosyltransferase involved in cell wall biosynthesis